jgi:2-oxoglutarate dehydrogenase E2 component (dihydrolipoamide succinyltransferase)
LLEEHDVDAGDIEGSGKDGRITKEDVSSFVKAQQVAPPPPQAEEQKTAAVPAAKEPAKKMEAPPPAPPVAASAGGERREPMSRLRQRIAQHLVAAQHNAAMLTTFNEIDLSAVINLRTQYKERFTEVHGVSLGFMSFFSRASILGLREFPAVNASIDGRDIVYHDYVNLGIAVSTERGLLVPVLRHAEQMSMAQVESEIKRLALSARDNKLAMDELGGGTFTITNGGVFGSLLSTPIINAPQSGILGMHAIQQRPVAVDGAVVIRPMMYVALSYDHRIIDGQQSVKFLVRLKQLVEDPARLILEV